MIRGRARPQAGYAAARVLGQIINGKLLKDVNGVNSRFSNFMFAYDLSLGSTLDPGSAPEATRTCTI